MPRLRLTLEYDGSFFSGWQIQPGKLTVQGELQRALGVLCGSLKPAFDFKVVGSGRTDAGVHALGQVAHVDLPEECGSDPCRIRASINALTHYGIAVTAAEWCSPSFDARRSARLKCYEYRMLRRHARGGAQERFAWIVKSDLDLGPMLRAAKAFIGEHDFTSFRASDCNAASPVRTVDVCELVRRDSERLSLVVHGRGFLKQMIRIMAGTLYEVGCGKLEPADIARIIAARDRSRAGITAPAHGLSLNWVRYE